jgi:hypothetical protein
LGEASHFGFGAVVESRCPEPLEHRVCSQHQGGNLAAHREVTEGGREMGFADPDRTQQQRPAGSVE